MTLKDEWAEILAQVKILGSGSTPDPMPIDKALDALATHTYKAVMGALPEMKEGSTNRKYTENDQPSSEWGYNAALTQVKHNLSELLEIPLKEE